MKKKLFSFSILIAFAFGVAGCYSYNITWDSNSSNTVSDTSGYPYPYSNWTPSYAVPPSIEPSAAYSYPSPIREQTPGYVPPPAASINPAPSQQTEPRVREQSPPAPVVPPQKAPAPRVRR